MDFFSIFIEPFNNDMFRQTIQVLESTWSVWLPIISGYIFLSLWLNYIRTDYIQKQGSVLLELRLPADVLNSPKGMEIFFTQIYQTGSATEIDTFWHGKIRPWWSLEYVSLEGEIHIYVWCQAKWKNLVEAQLYAQYHQIEIYEAKDPMSWVYHDPVGLPMWATYYKFTKDDVYPIKTYIDYGLDKEQEEEFKVDPLTALFEFLGSLRKGEWSWIQIVIQAHKEEKFKDARMFLRKDWKEAAEKEVRKIRETAAEYSAKEIANVQKRMGTKDARSPFPTVLLSKGQEQVITALERSIDKFPFEAVVRGMYVAKRESFQSVSINGLIGCVRQFSSNVLNGFKLGWFTDFDYPWEDWHRIRRNVAERSMLKSFKMRSVFHPPYKNFHVEPMILNTEELATMFHIPGRVAATPTLPRIPAKKVEAPPNIPT